MEEISREQAQALMREGELEGAVAVLKEVTAQNPGDAMAWQMMGAALGALGQTDDSIGAFQQAAELQPTSARVQFNLAVALMKSDRTTEARSHLEKALALDPGYEQARVKLKEIGGIAPDAGTPPPPDPTLGGGAAPKPVPVAPVPSPPPPAAAPTASLGAVGAPAAPKPAAPPPPTAPAAAAPVAMSLQPIGGGLAPIGGGSPSPASTPSATPTPPGAASGGIAGIGGMGGGASVPPPPDRAAVPARPVPPPSAGAGGYVPPAGAYAPKPTTPGTGDYFSDGTRSMGYDATRGMQGDWDSATRGWNWGAFTFGWLWLWAHGLRSLAIGFFLGSWVLSFLLVPLGKFGPIIIDLIAIAAQVGLGLMGNQLGRMERTWDSADDFKDCQRIWALWSIPFVPIQVIGLGMLALGIFATGAGK